MQEQTAIRPQLHTKANSVYSDQHDCIEFVAAMFDVDRQGLVHSLLNGVHPWKAVFCDTIDAFSLHRGYISIGDVVVFVPDIRELFKVHVGIYMGDDECMSKLGPIPDLWLLPLDDYITQYSTQKIIVCRYVP